MKSRKDLSDYLVRGILIGGSLGVFAGLAGFVEMARGAGLGMIMGFIAGLTLARREEIRREQKKNNDSE